MHTRFVFILAFLLEMTLSVPVALSSESEGVDTARLSESARPHVRGITDMTF